MRVPNSAKALTLPRISWQAWAVSRASKRAAPRASLYGFLVARSCSVLVLEVFPLLELAPTNSSKGKP